MTTDPSDQVAGNSSRAEMYDVAAADRSLVSSILVIKFRSMGDLVLITSLLDNLQRHYPNARISILSDAANAKLLAMRPGVEFIPYYRRQKGSTSLFRAFAGWASSVREMRSRRIDVLIDCTNTRTGAILASLSRAPVRIGYKPFKISPSRAFTQFASDWGRGAHYVDRYLSPLQSLGVPVLKREPHLEASADTQGRIAHLLAKQGLSRNAYVAVHAGARVPGRQWPPQNFAQVIDAISTRYGLRSILVGGPDEMEMARTLCGLSQTPPLNLVGSLPPEDLVALLAGCRFFLGNDSGPMHIAAAAGAPVVALFGLQSPEQWAPLGNGHVVVRPSMPCPCAFPDICSPPDPHATYCVRRLTADDVLDGVAVLMRSSEAAEKAP